MIDTPVLFIIFNRPALTHQVFTQIKKAQPKKLFISADGPRDNKPGEKDLCEATRKIVMDNIDWDCEVKTLFREKNAGCDPATFEALTWMFDHVDRGIMIEDDCLPTVGFFKYCDEMLERYRDDERIIGITGVNFFEEYNVHASYFFSRLGSSWGFCTWKRGWQEFDYSISAWADKKVKNKIRKHLNNDNLFKYYSHKFDCHLKDSLNGGWDYRWLFFRFFKEGLFIVPAYNQIKNIGYGPDSTHTTNPDGKLAKLATYELQFPLHLNNTVIADASYDNKIFDDLLKSQLPAKINLIRKIARRLKAYLK